MRTLTLAIHSLSCRSISFFTLLAVLLAAPVAQAVPITAPSGLNPGDQYRLVFFTSTTRDALSTNIADYNTFVTNVANSVPQLAALGTTWTAIASTSAVNARTNTSTDPTPAGPTGVPIFNLIDQMIATDYDDLWKGSLGTGPGSPNINANEFGTAIDNIVVWTGTTASGTANGSYVLGGPAGPFTFGGSGLTGSATFTWVQWGTHSRGLSYSLYAMSDVLTVVPEPGTGMLVAIGLVGLGARKRRAAVARRVAEGDPKR